MSGPRRRRFGPAVIATIALLVGGACSDDGGATGADTRLLLLDEPSWALIEAVDYRAGLGVLEARDPDLDWFAEYDGPRLDNTDGSYTVPHVSTFGHTAGLDDRRSQLPGFEHRSTVVDGRQALVSRMADGNPSVVIIEVASGYAVTLVTYDEGVDLSELADHLVAVDEAQWVAAGGTLLDCVPSSPGVQVSGSRRRPVSGCRHETR